MPPKTQNLHDIAVEHIRQCFNRTNQQVEQAGKDIAAYYFYLVDDFFCRRQRRHYPSRLSCLCRRARRRI